MKKDPAKIKKIVVVDWDETIATYKLGRYRSLIETQHQLIKHDVKILNSYDIHKGTFCVNETKNWSYFTLYPLLWALIIMYINLNETIALAMVTNATFEKSEIANVLNQLLTSCLHSCTVMEHNFSRNDFEFDFIQLNYLVDKAIDRQFSLQALFCEDDFAFRNRSPKQSSNEPKTNRIMDTIDELVPKRNMFELEQTSRNVIFFDNTEEKIWEVKKHLPIAAVSENRKINLSTIQAAHYFEIPFGQVQWPNWIEKRKFGLRQIIKFAQQVGILVTAGMAVT